MPRFRFRPLPVEDSRLLRGWTLVVVLIGVLAILHEEEWPIFGWGIVALTMFGYWLSYVRRGRPNWPLKILICFCMLWAMQQFFTDLFQNANDPRIPLANLLLWLQTLHAYDLPYRQNLNVSFFVGVVLLAVAAVMSTSGGFAVFLVAFVVAVLFMMQYSYLSWRSEVLARQGLAPDADRAPRPEVPRVRVAVTGRVLATYAGLLTVATLLGYACIPHYSGMRIRTMPIAISRHLARLGSGRITNPAFPQGVGPETAARGGKVFDPENYNGFNNYLDLNVRGHMANDIVMRVRTSRWTYYRALAFDHYNGTSWSIADDVKLTKHQSASPPVLLDPPFLGTDEIVQIFYVDRDMSNVVLGTFPISHVFFPGDTLYTDPFWGVRADFALEAGTTYSVISSVRPEDPGRLHRISQLPLRRQKYFENTAPYLQLPDSVTPRVRALAAQLTAHDRGGYDKALRLMTWLRQTYPYSLDTAPVRPGHEATDEFLYQSRAGSCEQFATALAVMCRCVGVPARLAVGYLPGNFNPLSGVYEVRASDAHAWVEVLVPWYGWVTLDPTPGYEAQPGVEQPRNRWVLQTLWAYVKSRVNLPAGLSSWLAERQRQAAAWVAALTSGRTGLLVTVAVAVVTGAGGALMAWVWLLGPWWRRRAPTARLPRWLKGAVAAPQSASPDPVRREYQRMLALLGRHGLRKTAGQTPREFARRTGYPEVADVTRVFEGVRYGGQAVQEQDVSSVRERLDSLEARLAEAKKRR